MFKGSFDTTAIAVSAAPLPFSNKRITLRAAPGSSIKDIVELVGLRDTPALGAIVQINGHKINRQHWHRVRPKPGTSVAVKIVPQGGGGGGKNPLATLLTIAVLIAAPEIGSFATLGAFGAGIGSFGTAIVVGQIATGAFALVGTLLVNALAPPPKPKTAGTVNNPAESPTQFIEGAQNTIDPFGIIPVCLGTNRMVPKQAAKPFVETQDNDQYVRQLFTWGFGAQLLVTNFSIGDTDISNFTGVDMEHRLAGDLNEGTSLYSNVVLEDDYSVVIQQVDGYTVRTGQPNSDECTVDITFGNGLCQFDGSGNRIADTVEMEVQYALTGTSPQVWSTPATTFAPYAGETLTPATVAALSSSYYAEGVTIQDSFRKDMIVIDARSGEIYLVPGTGAALTAGAATVATQPSGTIRLGTVTVLTAYNLTAATITTSIAALSDDRDLTQVGTVFDTSADFAPTISGATVLVASGDLMWNDLTITNATAEATRVSVNFTFPSRGQYDIRVRRISADTDSDQIIDQASLTAIKSIRHAPVVNLAGINGTAVRILGTDQLNGTIDQFNGIVSNVILDWDATLGAWTARATSNPASIARYVWQNFPNAKPLDDDEIDIEQLENWHVICEAKGYSYNRIIDYTTTVEDVIQDICAAGAASPDITDGKRTVVIDTEKDDFVQMVTPRNSYGYSCTITYPSNPDALRVQFRNPAVGYQQDERIVYADGFSEHGEVPGTVAATLFETLEYDSCTDPNLAFLHGRRMLATYQLRTSAHSVTMDMENLVATRGDRIKFAHDVPLIGVGDGRIKTITAEGSPAIVTAFSIDDIASIPDDGDYYVRVRLATGGSLWKQLVTSPGEFSEFTFATPFLLSEGPEVGDLCYFSLVDNEADMIITKIEPSSDLSAKITMQDYAPAIFAYEQGVPIPPFVSNVTLPLSLRRPDAPLLAAPIQSDESVMIRNSDGTYTSRMIITLENTNIGAVTPTVKVRPSGTDTFSTANVLDATANRVILTGLQDGTRYDLAIRYQRTDTAMISLPLALNGVLMVGSSSRPADVTGFLISITGTTASFQWNPNPDIDISHYVMRFSAAYDGALWENAQVISDNLLANRLTLPFQGGTYFIKAVDISGNESLNAAEIITFDPGQLRNVVETITESPTFAGAMDNVELLRSGGIVLIDTTLDGYYYFATELNLGAVYTSYLTAAVIAGGAYVNNIFDVDDMFALPDVFGRGDNDIFAMDDIFDVDDIFGIGTGSWEVELQQRTTNDRSASPVVWSDWGSFSVGDKSFEDIQFRIRLRSLAPGISPIVRGLSVTIDMPDRIISQHAITIPIGGARVDFSPAYYALKGLGIGAENLVSGDYYSITSRDNTGFTIEFFNSASSSKSALMSYDSTGYGLAQS